MSIELSTDHKIRDLIMFSSSIVLMKQIRGKNYMPEKCYKKSTSNITLGVCVCVFRFSQSAHELKIANQDTEN